jgi:predicted NBD/HSP70 family sugar kinase
VRTLAIDIGGSKVSLAIVDFLKDVSGGLSPEFVVERTTLTRDLVAGGVTPSAEDIIKWIRQASEIMLTEVNGPDDARARALVDSIGVGFGGQFDTQSQICRQSLHTDGWEGFRLADLFTVDSHGLGVRISGINDAQAAALAEARFYQKSVEFPHEIMLYITLSTGIGGAIAFLESAQLTHALTPKGLSPKGLTTKALIPGVQSLAGEVGHLQIPGQKQQFPSEMCSCGGTNCLERACSGRWIEQRTGRPASEYLAEENNFNDWIADLCQGLWQAITLLDPAVVCLGGGMTAGPEQGERVRAALAESIAERSKNWGRKPPEITLAAWGGRSVLLGAALLARESKLEADTK